MTIQQLVQQSLSTKVLSRTAEDRINELMWQHRYTSADLEALDQLTSALEQGQVKVFPDALMAA